VRFPLGRHPISLRRRTYFVIKPIEHHAHKWK
jgi:hypothetical protein